MLYFVAALPATVTE